MADRPFKVYVIQGRGERDYADCQTALDRVPAQLISLPFIGDADEVIARTRDADALIISSSPVTRSRDGVARGRQGGDAHRGGLRRHRRARRDGAGRGGHQRARRLDPRGGQPRAALLLAWNRKIVTLDREVHAGTWSSRVPGAVTGSLHGETVGIVGLGNIGSAFAGRIAALETHVIACDPHVDDARFAALGVERVDLLTLAARADYVSVHALLNAETRGLINDAFFKRMKPTACLVNTSRGPVVDERALVRALQAGQLAGAALDVFEEDRSRPTARCAAWTT